LPAAATEAWYVEGACVNPNGKRQSAQRLAENTVDLKLAGSIARRSNAGFRREERVQKSTWVDPNPVEGGTAPSN